MSDISDMVDVGVLCQECLQFIGEECGYPRTCEDCVTEKEAVAMSEKVWRGWAMPTKTGWALASVDKYNDECEEIVTIPAADYDALQARVVELERILADANSRDMVVLRARIATLEAELAEKAAECAKAVDSIWECRVFLRGCMNHAFDETPIVEVAKDVSEEFHRNRYQIQCIAKERDNIARERDATNLLLKRLMCVVVPDNAVPNDMKEFVRDSAATVLKDLWDYLKTDADLRKAEHDAG